MGRIDQPVTTSKPAKLRSFRRRMGLKQCALAEMLAVDQATVSRWESGKSPIDDGIWQKLLEIRKTRQPVSNSTAIHAGLDPDEHWPTLLRCYRATNNITQEELSETLGCSPDSISRWERGLYRPNLSTLTHLQYVIFSSADP